MLSWAMPTWIAGGTGCTDCSVNEVDLSKLVSGAEDCRRAEGFGGLRPRSEAVAQEPPDEERRLRDLEVTRIERELEEQKTKEQRRKLDSVAAEEAERQERAKQLEAEKKRKAFNQRFRERREALERQAALRSEAEARGRSEDRVHLDAWLERGGFDGVNDKKVSATETTYPLHAAVSQNNAEVARWLISFGANAEQQDSLGETPLDLAVRSNKDGCLDEVVKALETHYVH